jgi:hypothetical protein
MQKRRKLSEKGEREKEKKRKREKEKKRRNEKKRYKKEKECALRGGGLRAARGSSEESEGNAGSEHRTEQFAVKEKRLSFL